MAVPVTLGTQPGKRNGPWLVGSSYYALTYFDDLTNMRLRMKKASDPSSSWSTVGSGANEPSGVPSGKGTTIPAEGVVIGTKIYVAFKGGTNGDLNVKVFDTATDTWAAGAGTTFVASGSWTEGDFSIATNAAGDLAVAWYNNSVGAFIRRVLAAGLASMTLQSAQGVISGGAATYNYLRLVGGLGSRWHVAMRVDASHKYNTVKNDGTLAAVSSSAPALGSSMTAFLLESVNLNGVWKVVALGDDSSTGLRWAYADSSDSLAFTVASIAAAYDAADAARALGWVGGSWRFVYNRTSGGPAIRSITPTGSTLGTAATFRATSGTIGAFQYVPLTKVTLSGHHYYAIFASGSYDHHDPPQSTYTDKVKNDEPFAYYRLGDASGTVAAAEVGADGTYVGSPTLAVTGGITGDTDKAVTFDGVNDRVTLSDLGVGEGPARSIELLMKFTGSVGADLWAYSEGNPGDSISIFGITIFGGKIVAYFRPSPASIPDRIESAATWNDGLWHHVVVTKTGTSGGTMQLYIDGVSRGSMSLQAGNANVTLATLGALGRSSFTGFFPGSLDEVAAYDRVLTSTEIAAHNTARAGGGTTVTIGLATETDSALAMTRVKTRTIGLVTESDSALSTTAKKTLTIGLAAEADAALAMTHAKARALGLATESDSALAMIAKKLVAIGLATEADSALGMTVIREAIEIGLATEVDSAFSMAPAKRVVLGLVAEANLALPISGKKTKVLGLASELELALSMAALKSVAVGLATEVDVAQAFTGKKVLEIGLALEVDQALALVRKLPNRRVAHGDVAVPDSSGSLSVSSAGSRTLTVTP